MEHLRLHGAELAVVMGKEGLQASNRVQAFYFKNGIALFTLPNEHRSRTAPRSYLESEKPSGRKGTTQSAIQTP